MTSALRISAGQYSDQGRKDSNQDFLGLVVPNEPQLSSKGIAVALADGISSSDVSQVASQAAVTSFLEDYYCTSEAWSVKTAAERILSATNAWLHAQTMQSPYRYERDKGYVCTLSALVLKSTTAYLFHVGDSRIYRLRAGVLEQLTQDHRVWIANGQSYLARALGATPQLELDYQALPMEVGDVFVLATDGVYEHLADHALTGLLQTHAGDLDQAARAVAEAALDRGSADNLTVQIVRVDALPRQAVNEMVRAHAGLPFPPILAPRTDFDGFTIVRELHGSFRSHIYLALDRETDTPVVVKTPSIALQTDAAYVQRFLTEEWVARRINSAHVLKPCPQTRKRNYVYVVTEFIDGQTLAQWMTDNPKPTLEAVRGLVDQIGKGLQAFHRLEMPHQALRPDNIMIDRTGTAKIIDFGSTRVAGLTEAAPLPGGGQDDILGTVQYAAPEYFLGESGSTHSDIFSLGVLTYHMLTGRLPYGAQVARARTRSAQNQLQYRSVLDDDSEIPAWIDAVLRKAVHPNPAKRYAELSEFLYDLRHPNQAFLQRTRAPLIERNPLVFWKSVSALLAVAVIALLAVVSGQR